MSTHLHPRPPIPALRSLLLLRARSLIEHAAASAAVKASVAAALLLGTGVLAWAVAGLHPAAAAVAAAVGSVAGGIGVLVGFGTAITIPFLVALGVSPVVASVTTTFGLLPGSVSGAVAERHALAGHTRTLRWFAVAISLGSLAGAALLLLVLPASTFRTAAFYLIAVSLVALACQPRISAWLDARRGSARPVDNAGSADTVDVPSPTVGQPQPVTTHPGRDVPAVPAVLTIGVVGVIGGYFAGALGLIVLIALAATGVAGDLRCHNSLKLVLVCGCNGVAAAEVLVLWLMHRASVDWGLAMVLAGSSVVGAQLGSWLLDTIPKRRLRWVAVAIGVVGLACIRLTSM